MLGFFLYFVPHNCICRSREWWWGNSREEKLYNASILQYRKKPFWFGIAVSFLLWQNTITMFLKIWSRLKGGTNSMCYLKNWLSSEKCQVSQINVLMYSVMFPVGRRSKHHLLPVFEIMNLLHIMNLIKKSRKVHQIFSIPFPLAFSENQ